MDCWHILGIDPTSEVRAIKRAYAKLSAQNHPEEHPEQFQIIYAAYQQALAYAGRAASGRQPPDTGTGRSDAPPPAASEKEPDGIWKPGEETIDFAGLIRQHEEETLRALQETPVFREITRRLQQEALCDNQNEWKAFFLSDEFLREYSSDDFTCRLPAYLNSLPADMELPRQFAVWLDILCGRQYFRDMNRQTELALTRPISDLLDAQPNQSYHASELQKEKYAEIRISFAMFLALLGHIRKMPPYRAKEWRELVRPIGMEKFYWKAVDSPVFIRLLEFTVRFLPIPQEVYLIIFEEYKLSEYTHSSKRELLEPLFSVLSEVAPHLTGVMNAQKQLEQKAKDVYFAYCAFFERYEQYDKNGMKKPRPDREASLREFQQMLDSPAFEEVMLTEKLVGKLQQRGSRVDEDSYATMKLLYAKYLPHRANPLVVPLLAMLQEKIWIYESGQDIPAEQYNDTPRTCHYNPEYPFMEGTLGIYQNCQVNVTGWSSDLSPAQKQILALFSMLRTLTVLDGCDPKPRYGKTEYFREMATHILKHFFGKPQTDRDMNFSFYRQYPRSFYDFLYEQGLLNSVPFLHIKLLSQAWYAFCDFEFLQTPDFEPDMVHGFVLCPVAMLLNRLDCGQQSEHKIQELVEQQMEYVRQDCAFLSEAEKDYERYHSRAMGYSNSDDLAGALQTVMYDPKDETAQEVCQGIVEALGVPCERIENEKDGKAVLKIWNNLHRQGRREGFWPLLIVPSENLLHALNEAALHRDGATLAERLADYRQAALRQVETLDGKALLAKRLENSKQNCGIDSREILGELREGEPLHHFSCFMEENGVPCKRILIARIPVKNPWELAVWMPMGGFHDCPDAIEQAAIFKYWYEAYGAAPGAVTGCIWEMKLRVPPQGDSEALAMEHFAFSPDVVLQAADGWDTIRALAGTLRRSTTWFFWWD